MLLLVARASVERIFFSKDFVKTKRRRNKKTDSILDDCLITFIERGILEDVEEDDVVKTFMAIFFLNTHESCVSLSCPLESVCLKSSVVILFVF